MLKKISIAVGILALLLGAWFGYQQYEFRYSPITLQKQTLKVPSNGGVSTLLDSLLSLGIIQDSSVINSVALKANGYTYRPGQFEIQKDWSSYQLINHLRRGRQKEAKIILTHGRLIGDVAQKATRFIELDSASFHQAVLDSMWLDSVGLNPQTVMSAFIPNTYNVYWSASAKEVRDRLLKESKKFWAKKDRLAKADSLGLTPVEVYTLASIVESESKYNPEKPTIAGVYLNRLKRGIKLDADPTVVFAIGDFTLRRVLFKHLEVKSPYNTYLNPGLPPGPIAMPTIPSIDAVLQPETHNYLFFVARGDGSGSHIFAKNMLGHSRNIEIFKRNLRKRGIRR